MPSLRQLVTDYDNRTLETGRFLITVTVLAMVFLAGWDVIVNKVAFDAWKLGFGIGAAVAGLGVYLMGDKSAPATAFPASTVAGAPLTAASRSGQPIAVD